MLSQTSTSAGRAGCAIGQTVNLRGERGGQDGRNKDEKWTIKDTVFNILLRMQAVVLILISTCLWGTTKSTPVIMDKDPRPSKYTAQLFDCRVPGKIQLLQIPETCDGTVKEGEMATLRETYVLSPRKLKKASGVSCRASVSKFHGYCGMYSHWKFPYTVLSLPFTVLSLPYTVFSLPYTYSAQSPLYSAQSPLYSAHCSVSPIQCLHEHV